jgi:hypothetical protein
MCDNRPNGTWQTKVLHSPEVSNILRRLAAVAGEVFQAKTYPLRATISNDEGARKAMIYGLFSMQRRFQGSRGLKHVRPLKMGDNQA